MSFTDLVPIEDRSLEDRAHPLVFRNDESGRKRIDGMHTARLPQPIVFDIHTKPEKLRRFGRLFAVEGIPFSRAARTASIHNYVARKFIQRSGLRGAGVQRHFTEQREIRDERRSAVNGALQVSKWQFVVDALLSTDVFRFSPEEPCSTKLCRSLYHHLGQSLATHLHKWSVRWDRATDEIVVRRTGSWIKLNRHDSYVEWNPSGGIKAWKKRESK